MKKYDMRTRQGRARRANNYKQFNPDTLQPHTKGFLVRLAKMKKGGK